MRGDLPEKLLVNSATLTIESGAGNGIEGSDVRAGCTVALVTPFRDREVDYQALGELVDWQIPQGTHVLSPVGTTGESPTLSHEEHERVIATGGQNGPRAG